MNERQALFFLQLARVRKSIVVGVAVQDDFAIQRAHRVHLDRRRGDGHHDHGANAAAFCGQGYALRVIAGRTADHARL